jgi:hypothetical protein
MAGSGSFSMVKGEADFRLDELKKLLWSVDEQLHNCGSMEKPGVLWCKSAIQTRMQLLEASKRAETPPKAASSGSFQKAPSGSFTKPGTGILPKKPL